MVQFVTQELMKHNLTWKMNKEDVTQTPVLWVLSCGSNFAHCHRHPAWTNQDGTTAVFVEEVEALGVLLCSTMATHRAVRHRLQQGKKQFYADMSFSKCKGVALEKKLKRYASTIQPAIIHCFGGWALTKNIGDRLGQAEGAMLNTMMCRRKPGEMEWKKWHEDTAREARKTFRDKGFVSLIDRFLVRVWKMATAVGAEHAMCLRPARRAVLAFMMHGSQAWREHRSATARALDARNTTGMKRRRTGGVRTHWDQVLVDMDANWQLQTRCKDGWERFLEQAYTVLRREVPDKHDASENMVARNEAEDLEKREEELIIR